MSPCCVPVAKYEGRGHGRASVCLQLGQSLVDVAGGGLDQAVGAEHEQAVVGQVQLERLERRFGGAQRRVAGQLRAVDRPVGMDDDRRRVTGQGVASRSG